LFLNLLINSFSAFSTRKLQTKNDFYNFVGYFYA